MSYCRANWPSCAVPLPALKMAVQLPIATFGVSRYGWSRPPITMAARSQSCSVSRSRVSLTLFGPATARTLLRNGNLSPRLAVPLLVAEPDGDLREPIRHVGSPRRDPEFAAPRRAARSRRPTIFLRRSQGGRSSTQPSTGTNARSSPEIDSRLINSRSVLDPRIERQCREQDHPASQFGLKTPKQFADPQYRAV